MRAKSRVGLVAVVAIGMVGSFAGAQVQDTIRVGDRVRVRVAATRGNTNLFVGNLASVSPDTLVIDLPGGKGTIILPRAAIAEVAKSQGNESRWKSVPGALPFAMPGLMVATLPAPPGPHHNSFQNQRYVFGALATLPMVMAFIRRPNEKWEPVYRWLEGR